jgi:large subunit ribosomal protein L6
VSRIGKQPVAIPAGVQVTKQDHLIKVKGPKGELSYEFPQEVEVTVEEKAILVTRTSNEPRNRGMHGLAKKMIDNMVQGVTTGFAKELEIVGVGYKAQVSGKKFILSLGFSHPVEFPIPEGITIEPHTEVKNGFVVKGVSKHLVGETCALIRKYRPPEPYKGKGIKYVGEKILRKAGKSASK